MPLALRSPVGPRLPRRQVRTAAGFPSAGWRQSTLPETSLYLRMMVDGARAPAESGIGPDGLMDKPLRASHGLSQRQAARKPRGDGGRVGAAGSAGMARPAIGRAHV